MALTWHEKRAMRLAAAIALMVGALCTLGPWLDQRPEPQRLDDAALIERMDRKARAECAGVTGENGGFVRKRWGTVVCTDKHGRQVAQKEAR